MTGDGGHALAWLKNGKALDFGSFESKKREKRFIGMIRQTTLSVAIMLCAVAFGGTVKVPLKTGWRFVKADDPAAGTNLTLHAMSAILDRAEKGEALADCDLPSFTWAKPEFDDSSWRAVNSITS